MNSNMRPDSPLSPSLFPATENDWHGEPPTTSSTLPLYLFQSTCVMSPRLGTPGNLCASTALGNGSISENATGSHPSGPNATLAASIPEKTLMYLTRRTLPTTAARR